MHRNLLLVAAHAAVLLTSASARAEDAPTSMLPPTASAPPPDARPKFTEAPEPRGGKWYGWQILLPTLASDAFIAGGFVISGNGTDNWLPLELLGVGGRAFSGSIVHLAHGHPGRAAASFGIQVGATGLGALAGLGIGSASDSCPPPPPRCFDAQCSLCSSAGGIAGAALGALIGATVATGLDVGVLAFDDERRSRPSALVLLPFAAPHAAGGAIGGSF